MLIEKAYGFIYITTNMINGKRYIGQKKFRKDWQYYLGSGKAIKRAIRKYGRNNFKRDIVAIGYDGAELDRLEAEWIKNYNAIEDYNFYNIAEGGNGNSLAGKSKKELAIISKKKSERFSSKNNPMYGKKGEFNPHSKKIICLNTHEIFESITEASLKYNLDISSVTKCCRFKSKYSGKLENSEKIVWRYLDDYNLMSELDIKNLLSRAQNGITGKYNPKAKKVICLNDNKIFNTVIEASEYYNISKCSIQRVCRGLYKQTKGYSFMYYEEYLKE